MSTVGRIERLGKLRIEWGRRGEERKGKVWGKRRRKLGKKGR